MKQTSSLRIIVTGLIAQHPWLGGVTWDYLQYPLGLARLGHDVYYFEDSGEWPYTIDGGPSGTEWIANDCTAQVEHLAQTMKRFGFEDRWAYHFPIKQRWYGLSSRRRKTIMDSADLVINVSGTLFRPGDYRKVKRLAFIDSDPAFTQIKYQLATRNKKDRARVDIHDVHFSFGESFTSAVPSTGHDWRPTRQPIVLSEWHPSRTHRNIYTTVMSWTSYKPLHYQDQIFGQKDLEFAKFLNLPQRVPNITLEIAMNKTQHLKWQADNCAVGAAQASNIQRTTPQQFRRASGWRVVDAAEVSADLDSYRNYIESSKAEWSVAKNGYVVGRAGWFSCRSACYLAAGKPVIVQDTGFGATLPVGTGILPFSKFDEAVAAIQEVESNYRQHSTAARAIAEDYFDSDKVLRRLVEEAFSHGN